MEVGGTCGGGWHRWRWVAPSMRYCCTGCGPVRSTLRNRIFGTLAKWTGWHWAGVFTNRVCTPNEVGGTGKVLHRAGASVRCHAGWRTDTRPSRLLREIGAMQSVDQSVIGRYDVHERSCESQTCGDLHAFVPVVHEAGPCLRRTLQFVSAGITMRDTNHPGMQLTRFLINLFAPH